LVEDIQKFGVGAQWFSELHPHIRVFLPKSSNDPRDMFFHMFGREKEQGQDCDDFGFPSKMLKGIWYGRLGQFQVSVGNDAAWVALPVFLDESLEFPLGGLIPASMGHDQDGRPHS
jgi:hypothetical protein